MKGELKMRAAHRREEILKILEEADAPVSASSIASLLGVSRQIIVGDVALLRASNQQILATPRGYVMQKKEKEHAKVFTAACKHDLEHLGEELYAVVDNGGKLLDVTVEHPLYGQISGQLQVGSRYDADNFLHALAENKAAPLCNLTGGVHLHAIQCENEAVFARIEAVLREKGFLFESK